MKTKIKSMPVPPDGPDTSKAVIWFDSERIVNFALSNVKPSEVVLFGQILVEAGMKMHGPPVEIIKDVPKNPGFRDSVPGSRGPIEPKFKVGDMVVLSPKGKAEKIGELTPWRFKHWPAKVLRVNPHDGDDLYIKNYGPAHYILDNDGPPAGGVHEVFLKLAEPKRWRACNEPEAKVLPKKKRGRPKGCKDKKKRRKRKRILTTGARPGRR